MMVEEFSAGDWIDRLAGALPGLAEAQEAYLPGQRKIRVFLPAIPGVENGGAPTVRVEELGDLYVRARHSRLLGEEAHYAALNAALDPVRHILLRHPTIARVVGPMIGRDNFYMQVLNSGGSTSPVDLAAGLMARAAEHSVDGFRKAAGELHAFLVSSGKEDAPELPDGLDRGCDVALFHGPVVEEWIDVGEDVTLLPFEEVRAFVDEEFVYELAPRGAGFHGYRSVGAAVRTYRWRPAFYRAGYERELDSHDPGPFFRRARTFLQLLGVAHAAPVLPFAELSHRIDRSAGRLLGRGEQSPGFYQSWPAKGFDGFDEGPVLRREALAEAKEAFENRASERYRRMAPVVGRLAEALARNGPFAVADRVLDVGIALERMYVLDGGHISRKLRNRAARYLAPDGPGQESIRESAQEFYDVRSDIVHNRLHRLTPERVHTAFCNGFDIASRSLFKLLREGPREDWKASRNAGEGRSKGEKP
ncbi:MAG: HEPN domain-containing protein [Gemmatimonadota bacterium]|nr:HEPN domain-containing protein [Gemmatimonadota bacterium]